MQNTRLCPDLYVVESAESRAAVQAEQRAVLVQVMTAVHQHVRASHGAVVRAARRVVGGRESAVHVVQAVAV